MKQQSSVTRQERLGRLADFCPTLLAALQHAGLSSDVSFLVFRDLVRAECSECHTKVAGDELYVLAQSSDGQDLSVRIHRLRLGFCANTTCRSFHCQLTFQPDERVDWHACLARADRTVQDLEDSRAGRGKRWRSELVRPTIIGVAVILILLLVHRLYFGGRIPLIREPEKWRVDPDPAGEAHAR
jgi:hypothetical protein